MRHRLLFVASAALLASDAAAGSRAESEEKLARASIAYDMKIDIAGHDTKVDSGVACASMTSTHATLALPIFLPELTRYPSDFFSSTGIQRMVLCGDLTHGGKRVGGLAVGGRIFYLNLRSANVNARHAQRTFHHEVFHLVDGVDDREWQNIHGGFISEYAKTNSREDRAELFAEMMVNRRSVAAKASNDRAVEEKAQLIESWVESSFPALFKQLRK